jgi:hypothetical protein
MIRINLITETLNSGREIRIREMLRREELYQEIKRLGATGISVFALGCLYLILAV